MTIKIKVCNLTNDEITKICRHYYKPCNCKGCPLRRWKDKEQTQELFCYNYLINAFDLHVFTKFYNHNEIESITFNECLTKEIEVNEELLK